MDVGTEQRREEGHFRFMKGRLKKASQRKGDSMIYAVIRVIAPRQPLPGDAFRDRSIRPFHPDEWTSNVKGQRGEMRMMLSDESLFDLVRKW